MFLNLQIRYVVDSWVEFVTRRKALSTRKSQETGHYICYNMSMAYFSISMMHLLTELISCINIT